MQAFNFFELKNKSATVIISPQCDNSIQFSIRKTKKEAMILLIKPQTYPLPSMVKPLSVSSGGCDIGPGLGGGVIGLDSSNKLGGGAKAAPPEWKNKQKNDTM